VAKKVVGVFVRFRAPLHLQEKQKNYVLIGVTGQLYGTWEG
jgi:hypothetical protein